ncbi:MAG TPA: XylR family transcriptional regulator [Verrucomicrobiae bacterium]|nr:XylR family transcriptional regulator [Verrucomicrobiae bacterium]
MRRKTPRVLLALGWYDHRVHQGIARYAEKAGWHLCADVTKEKVIPWGWEGDGILAWLGAGDDLAEFVVQAKLPTVDFSIRRPHLPFPRVLTDHVSAARLVADHFLTHGLKNFMFYSAAANWSFDETGQAFVETLKAAGHPCNWIRWHKSAEFTTGHFQWKDKRRWLGAQLKQSPKPLAVFAASDDHALEVLEICDALGISVPEQVSLIGLDNSLLAVEAMHTPISSVDRNLETVGYRGAELLDQLMKGKPAPKEPIRVPPTGLIARKSSDLLAINHPGIARSLRFMWEHCHEPIHVDDLAKIASMSVRNFHHAFVTNVGRSPGNELQRIRIERAKKLLSDTTEKMDVIGEMCGYENGNSFWVAFKRATGMSPKAYQKKQVRALIASSRP